MNPESYRYTDDQVRSDWHMFAAVVEDYLRDYTGSFEVLTLLRKHLAGGAPLNVPQVRTVLNCMRHDTNVTGLPTPTGKPKDYVEFGYGNSKRNVIDIETRKPLERQKSRYIKLPTKLNKSYGMSTSIRSTRLHMLHPDSYIEYDRETQLYNLKIWWYCTTPWGMPRCESRVKLKLYTAEEAAFAIRVDELLGDDAMVLCKLCEEKWERHHR